MKQDDQQILRKLIENYNLSRSSLNSDNKDVSPKHIL